MSIRHNAKANQNGKKVPKSAPEAAYNALDFHQKSTNMGSEGQFNQANGTWRTSNSQFRR